MGKGEERPSPDLCNKAHLDQFAGLYLALILDLYSRRVIGWAVLGCTVLGCTVLGCIWL